ncbi:MAG: DUF2785 domain-containing protein [Proteobacteria bacterium]|nr:DUF2785 domain-containing protein [Pseudomonadota bacterium]
MSMRMRLLCGALCLAWWPAAQAACPPEGSTLESLQAMKLLRFAVDDPATRDTLALGLVDCLGDPDPALRDGIAYEALAHWMRAGALEPSSLRALRDRLYAVVDGGEGDGFARPFAALVLSEVARTDRISPWMTPQERTRMVDKAADYVESVQDYRGFDDKQGWRHGVAHGADWLMQLALNPALDLAQAGRILAAVATQAVPESAHAYVFGEQGRLVRPVVAVARHGLLTDADWATWFASLPPRMGEAELAYADSDWLARRHDLMTFFTSLYLEADQSSDERIRALKPAVVAALKTVP